MAFEGGCEGSRNRGFFGAWLPKDLAQGRFKAGKAFQKSGVYFGRVPKKDKAYACRRRRMDGNSKERIFTRWIEIRGKTEACDMVIQHLFMRFNDIGFCTEAA